MNFSYRSRPQPRLPEVASHPMKKIASTEKEACELSFGCWDSSLHNFERLTYFCHELERGKTLSSSCAKTGPSHQQQKKDHCQPWSLHPGREIVSVESLASPEASDDPKVPRLTTPFWWRKGVPALRLYQFGVPLCLHFFKSKFCRNLRGHGYWMIWMMLLDVDWNFQLPRYLM